MSKIQSRLGLSIVDLKALVVDVNSLIPIFVSLMQPAVTYLPLPIRTGCTLDLSMLWNIQAKSSRPASSNFEITWRSAWNRIDDAVS